VYYLVPRGRDEAGLADSMECLRHHDRYEAEPPGLARGLGRSTGT
jgi:hypothetical protein